MRPRTPSDPRPCLRVLGAAVPALLLSGCAWLGAARPEPAPGPSAYERGLGHLTLREWDAADAALREAAGRCENGEVGRRALALLSTVWLEPENPAAHPDSAAVLAARVLQLPDADPVERAFARSLYFMALELGADPYLRPELTEAPGAPALRFSDCGAPVPRTPPPLPVLGREALAATVHRLEGEREALSAKVSQLDQGSAALQRRIRDLEAELQTATSELERVRRLLAGPDTTRAGPP